MRYYKYLILILVCIFPWSILFAQGCEDGDPPAAGESQSAMSTTIFGYIQPEYVFNFTEGQENTIEFKRARIGARGKVSGDFSYYFMLETSPFIGSSGDAYLMDAFVKYNKYNWANAAVGTFKQPFSLELATPCHKLITIERSMVTNQLVAPQRDFGLMISGGNKYTRLNYAVALMNGRGLRVRDDNARKDIVGRATFKVAKFLTLGGSFRYGYPIPNNNEDSRTSVGGEFALDFANFYVQGEYIYDQGAYYLGSGGGCGSTPVALGETRGGAFIMAYYRITEKFHPVFKYEYFDPDMETSENSSYEERMTLGVNYFITNKVRFQLNYLANNLRVTSENGDALKAQIQVKF